MKRARLMALTVAVIVSILPLTAARAPGPTRHHLPHVA